MRAAVYCGTRNVYQDMIPSMKSLLIHSNVDKIYFLIEDDEFPYELPPEVECINVSNQQWFNEETCPNMKNRCNHTLTTTEIPSHTHGVGTYATSNTSAISETNVYGSVYNTNQSGYTVVNHH